MENMVMHMGIYIIQMETLRMEIYHALEHMHGEQ